MTLALSKISACAGRPSCQTSKAISYSFKHDTPARHITENSNQHQTHEVHHLQPPAAELSRRELLTLLASTAALGLAHPLSAPAAGSPSDDSAPSPSSRVAAAIRRDFVERQYYVTGDLSPELFAPDCVFKDPTVEVTGVQPYVRALQTLFDPTTSRADLISLEPTGPNTLLLRWRLEGSLKVGGLRIKPYTGSTTYTLSDDGRVVRHEETWDISTLDAFVSTFIPGFGAPPAPPVASQPV